MQETKTTDNQKCKNCGYISNVINPSVFRSSNPINNVEIPKIEMPKEIKQKYEYRFVNRFNNDEAMAAINCTFAIALFILLGISLFYFISSEYLISSKAFLSLFVVRGFMFIFTKEIVRVKI